MTGLLAAAAWTPLQIVCFALFVLAVLFILYALFGYPLLLGWVSRRANNPIHKQDKPRPISIVIAVRNGEKFLEAKLRSIFDRIIPAS